MIRPHLPLALLLFAIGCDSPLAPELCASPRGLNPLEIPIGHAVEVEVCHYVAAGDDLTYTATSSDTDVFTVTVSGKRLRVTGHSAGTAEIRVTATDSRGRTGTATHEVVAMPPWIGGITACTVEETDDGYELWTDERVYYNFHLVEVYDSLFVNGELYASGHTAWRPKGSYSGGFARWPWQQQRSAKCTYKLVFHNISWS